MQYPHTILVGIPTQEIWSVARVVSRDDRTFILTLTVHSQTPEPSEMGKRYLEELLTWFDGSPTFEAATDFLSRYVFPPECCAAFAFIDQERTLFYVFGPAKVCIKRAGSYLSIIEGAIQPQCVKGTLFPADILVIGTRVFFDTYESTLSEASDPLEAAQKLLSQTQTHEMADICGCVFSFSKEHIEAATPEVVQDSGPFVPQKQIEIQRSESIRQPLASKRKRVFVWLSVSPTRRKALKLVVAGLLLIGIFLSVQRFVLYRREMRIKSAVTPLQTRYDQIGSDNPPRVEKERLLGDLLNDVGEAAKTAASDPATSSKLFSLREKVLDSYQQVSKQTQVEHLSIFYDFRLVTADFVASQVAYDVPGKLAVFLDTNRNRMVSLSLEKKQPQTLSLNSDLGAAVSVTIVDRKAYVLGTKGIYEVSLPLDTAGKNIVEASSDWQEPKMIGSFATNLYVVDREARQIFRYDRSDPAASPSAWLKRKEGIDFGSLNSLAIDGDIFLSTTQGKINKLTRGEPVGFSLTDLLKVPDSSLVVYTDEESPYLYFLEPHAKRIFITDKSGQYVMSIVSQDLEAATGLIVDEEGKKIYVLAGSLVYEVSFIIPS
ncbi:MAG: hypothetical protein ABI758_05210 [Candidatus Woesebacteria bacterium]